MPRERVHDPEPALADGGRKPDGDGDRGGGPRRGGPRAAAGAPRGAGGGRPGGDGAREGEPRRDDPRAPADEERRKPAPGRLVDERQEAHGRRPAETRAPAPHETGLR